MCRKGRHADYSFIKRHIWEEFVEKMSTDEAKAKSQEYSELAKKNVLPHHLGMTRYTAKRKKWWQEEREAVAAEQPNPFKGIDERGRDFFNARRLKKQKEGRTKYNVPKTEEAEKALIVINAAKERGGVSTKQGARRADRGAGKPQAPWPCSRRILKAKLEECGLKAIRHHHSPHEVEIQGRPHPEMQI